MGDETAELRAAYFLVGREGGPYGFVWRVGWAATSFYLKPHSPGLSLLKVSVHGPDPRPELSPPGFKLSFDESARAKFSGNGVAAGNLPASGVWFPGVQVTSTTQHVVRLRSTWDMFDFKSLSAPTPPSIRNRAMHGMIRPPRPGYAADVDLYVSASEPYWGKAEATKAANARIGPLRNRAGQVLTCISTERSVLRTPTPSPEMRLPPRNRDDRMRGIATQIDPNGLLWITEQVLSRSAMTVES
jgi:hypothetical protein